MVLSNIGAIIKEYNRVMKKLAKEKRPGIIRAEKGRLVERITESLVQIAWKEIGGNPEKIVIDAKKEDIIMREEYIGRQKDKGVVLKDMLQNKPDYKYMLSVDKHVKVDGKFVLAIECKAYAENAMLKRVCLDLSWLKEKFPDLECVFFQLESQLGGDYSELKNPEETLGSKPSHSILSKFPIDLTIITLLKGERNPQKPIHKPEFRKSLPRSSLESALKIFKEKLKPYLK